MSEPRSDEEAAPAAPPDLRRVAEELSACMARARRAVDDLDLALDAAQYQDADMMPSRYWIDHTAITPETKPILRESRKVRHQ